MSEHDNKKSRNDAPIKKPTFTPINIPNADDIIIESATEDDAPIKIEAPTLDFDDLIIGNAKTTTLDSKEEVSKDIDYSVNIEPSTKNVHDSVFGKHSIISESSEASEQEPIIITNDDKDVRLVNIGINAIEELFDNARASIKKMTSDLPENERDEGESGEHVIGKHSIIMDTFPGNTSSDEERISNRTYESVLGDQSEQNALKDIYVDIVSDLIDESEEKMFVSELSVDTSSFEFVGSNEHFDEEELEAFLFQEVDDDGKSTYDVIENVDETNENALYDVEEKSLIDIISKIEKDDTDDNNASDGIPFVSNDSSKKTDNAASHSVIENDFALPINIEITQEIDVAKSNHDDIDDALVIIGDNEHARSNDEFLDILLDDSHDDGDIYDDADDADADDGDQRDSNNAYESLYSTHDEYDENTIYDVNENVDESFDFYDALSDVEDIDIESVESLILSEDDEIFADITDDEDDDDGEGIALTAAAIETIAQATASDSIDDNGQHSSDEIIDTAEWRSIDTSSDDNAKAVREPTKKKDSRRKKLGLGLIIAGAILLLGTVIAFAVCALNGIQGNLRWEEASTYPLSEFAEKDDSVKNAESVYFYDLAEGEDPYVIEYHAVVDYGIPFLGGDISGEADGDRGTKRSAFVRWKSDHPNVIAGEVTDFKKLEIHFPKATTSTSKTNATDTTDKAASNEIDKVAESVMDGDEATEALTKVPWPGEVAINENADLKAAADDANEDASNTADGEKPIAPNDTATR